MLPIPDRAQVWTAITTEREVNEIQRTVSSPSADRADSKWFVGLFCKRNRLAWAGSMLLLAFSLAGLLIMSASNGENTENEVVRTFQLENPIPAPNGNQATELNAGLPDSGTDSPVKGVNSVSKDREGAKTRRKTDSRTTAATDNRTTRGMNRSISPTRGSITPCAVGRTIEMELGSHKSDLILRWRRVRNAAKYHLYVSDDNEILIDEFETDQDTSYVLKKPLDPSKAYKWKIVITLENGQVIVADSQKFTSEDIRSVQEKVSSKRQRSVTRCSESQ